MGSIAPPPAGSSPNAPAPASPLAAWDSWSNRPLFVKLPAGKKEPPPYGVTRCPPIRPASLISEIPPGHNAGLICGPPLGWSESWVIVVIDLDAPGERPRLYRFLDAHGLQTIATAKTGGDHGGYHYWLSIPVSDWLTLADAPGRWVFDDNAPGGARPTRTFERAHFDFKITGYVVCPPSAVVTEYRFTSPPMSPHRCEELSAVNGPALRGFIDAATTATATETDTNSGISPPDSHGVCLSSLRAATGRESREGSKGGADRQPTASESRHTQPRGVHLVDRLYPPELSLWRELLGRMHSQRYSDPMRRLYSGGTLLDVLRPPGNLDHSPSAAMYQARDGEWRYHSFTLGQSFDFLDMANVYLNGAHPVRLGGSTGKQRIARQVVDYFGIWTKEADRFRSSQWPGRLADGLHPDLRAVLHRVRDRAIEYMRLGYPGGIASTDDIATAAGWTRASRRVKAGHAVEALRHLGLIRLGRYIKGPGWKRSTRELIPCEPTAADVVAVLEELRTEHRVDLAGGKWWSQWRRVRIPLGYGYVPPPKVDPTPLEPQRDADTERARAFLDSLRATVRRDAQSRGVGRYLHQVDAPGEEHRTYPPPSTGPP